MKYEKAAAEVVRFSAFAHFMTASGDAPGGVRCGVYSGNHCTQVSSYNSYNGTWDEHSSGNWVWDDYAQTKGHWTFF